MADAETPGKNTLRDRWQQFKTGAPWRLAAGLFKLLFGFSIEGFENIPEQGSFLIAVTEYAIACTLTDGHVVNEVVNHRFAGQPEKTMSYMQEEMWTMAYFRNTARDASVGRIRALQPHAAGRLALGLLEGVPVLRGDGIVIMNAEDDMAWDGRPLPMGKAMAWLTLHTAAPTVPLVATPGAYDVWPR